ncbi:MAG: hypothetical protein ABIZ05_14995 [Pseudonocardiaceae bacterium]
MNTRGVMFAVGVVIVTAGVLIELVGYIDDRTNIGEASRTLRPLSGPVAASGENSPPPARETTPRTVQTMADDPYLAVHYLYRAIANGSATGCAVFSPTAAQQFAENFHAADCPAAITRLNIQVSSPIKYASTGQRSPDVYPGDTMTISSCEISPQGGPPLGRFILQRTEQSKWYISGHETETC